MSLGFWIVLALGLITVAAIAEAFWKRNRKSPMADKFTRSPSDPNQKRELGLKATDLDLVEKVTRENDRIEAHNQKAIRSRAGRLRR